MNRIMAVNAVSRLKSRLNTGTVWINKMISNQTTESRSRRYIMLFSNSANVSLSLVGGNFAVGLYTVLNVSDVMLGILTTIAQLCNIAQILSPLLLDRFKSRKKIIIILRIIYHLFLVVLIGLIPFIPAADGFRIGMLVLCIIVANLAAALAGPGNSVLHIRSIPEYLRADFFSLLTIVNNVLVHAFVLFGGMIVDHMKDAGSLLAGVTVVRAIAIVFSVLEIIATYNIHEFKEPDTEEKKKFAIRFPFKNKKFMMCCLLAGTWSFSANIPGLYYSSYIINDAGVPYSFLGVVAMLSLPVYIVFTPIWNKVISKHSWFKSISVAMIIFAFSYYVCTFVTGANYIIIYPIGVILGFISAPCINIVFSNMGFLHLPETDRSGFLAFYAGFNSFMAMIGLFFGAQWVRLTGNTYITIFAQVLQTKQYIYILTGTLLIGLSAAFMLLRKNS